MTGERAEKFEKPDSAVGLGAVWLSEMGDEDRLSRLLRYADSYMEPTWQKGGLFYPRRDELYDEDGHFVHMDPWVGNTLIAFGRLNVEDGLHKLYASPWTAEHFEEPNLSDISRYADVLRGAFLAEENALIVTVRPDDSAKGRDIALSFANVRRGRGAGVSSRMASCSAPMPISVSRRTGAAWTRPAFSRCVAN